MAAPPSGPEQAPSFSSPQEEALLTLLRAADHLQRAMYLRLKPADLTGTQYNVLRILRAARPTGLTCSAIGSRMIAADPDITRLLGRLKAQKLIRQQRDTRDRRVVWTHITERGLDVLTGLGSLVEQAPRELLKELTQADLKELTRLTKKTLPNLAATGHREEDWPATAKRPSPASPLRRPLE